MNKLEKVLFKPIRILLLFTILAIVAFVFFLINNVVNKRIDKLVETIVESKKDEIDNFLFSKGEEVKRLSQFYDETMSIEENVAQLKYINGVSDNYESLGIVDMHGIIKLTTGIEFSIAQREYYKEMTLNNKDIVFSDLIQSFEDNENIIIILKKLDDDNLLSAAINVEYLNEILNVGNNFEFPISLLDSDGEKIFSDNKVVNGKVYQKALGIKNNWRINVIIPESFFWRTLVFVNISLLLFTIVAYVITQIILRRIIRKTTAPIDKLSSHMLGELKPITLESTIYEIDNLEKSYNNMLGRINNLISQVEIAEQEKKDSDYISLLEQVKPHFLYNTLETIQAMALDYDDERIENSIGLLGKYFRLSLSGHKKFISIDDELMLVKTYIDILKLRHRDNLKCIVENNLNGKYYILKFTIQPLIENAIKYGNGNTVEIILNENNENIIIKIVNNSDNIGFINEINDSLSNDKKVLDGNGLYNVNKRLYLYFKEKCISFSGEEGKVIVNVKFPKIRSVDNENSYIR